MENQAQLASAPGTPGTPTPGQAGGIDPSSVGYRVRAHAFNALTRSLPVETFVPLSDRSAAADAVIAAIEPLIREDERAAAVPAVRASGQAVYETWRAAVPEIVCNVPGGPWDELSPAVRAGFDAIAAQQPQTEPEPNDALYPSVVARMTTALRDVLHACNRGDVAPAIAPLAANALADVDKLYLPQSAPDPAAMTPAVARPAFGSTLILAVGDAPDDSVRELRAALVAATEGDHVTVVVVRGIEALRTWEPQPAPELAPDDEQLASAPAGASQ